MYGIVSYAAGQRSKEMGVRMALGATPVRLRGKLLVQGLLTILAGAIPGVAAAFLSGRFLESLIYGAKPIGFGTSAFAVLFIASIASASVWAATHRIATLDIMEVLRNE
jgi:ABC-type antimicrobial peptide transport system permease subunit